MRFRPSRRLIALVAIILIAATGITLAEMLLPAWRGLASPVLAWVLAALGLGAILDLWQSRRAPAIRLERRHEGSLALGQWSDVILRVRHDLQRETTIEIHDFHPPESLVERMPLKVMLRPGQFSELRYRMRPLRRGPAVFAGLELRQGSKWGLWEVQHRIPLQTEVRVYPNFAAVSGFGLLTKDNQVARLGVRPRPRRGEGREFHQLREYRPDDSIRQIDWKATSRRLQLISREFQDERDQQVVLMLDSGRRMRTQDGELSHFDQALNASLMLSFVALRQGDSVAMMSFGNGSRWMPAVKGATNVHQLLNRFYDLYPGNHASDYLRAGQELMSRQHKRALIVILTNLRDEDAQDLLMCVRLLRRKHLVLLANLREEALDQACRHKVGDFDRALEYTGTVAYLAGRRQLQEQLQAEGLLVMDVTPNQLGVEVINRYLAIKRTDLL